MIWMPPRTLTPANAVPSVLVQQPRLRHLLPASERRANWNRRGMLWTPGCDFNWQADNIGSTYTDAGLGTQITSAGTAHTKNSTKTSILSALTYDCYGLTIGFVNGNLSTASRRFMTDIYLDPAGGTSWDSTPLIQDLLSNNTNQTMGGTWYFFPVFIKAGTSIGATCQAEAVSVSQRIVMIAFGQPSHPELWRCGSAFNAFTPHEATTTGESITSGASGSMGSWTDISGGTSMTDDYWWYQSGMSMNDTTQTAVGYWVDFAVGDASNKYIVIQGAHHLNVGTTEIAGYRGMGIGRPPTRQIKGSASQLPYARMACSGTADSNLGVILYAFA